MSSAVTEHVLLTAAPSASSRRWIESPLFDSIFFILGPLLVIPVAVGVEQGIGRLMIVGILLAFPHYFSSAAFYFWDERRDYYRQRWIAFYLGPVILGAVYLTLIYLKVPLIVQIVLFFWNVFHVARQSCGILSIYRHATGVVEIRHRNAANFAILSTSAFLSLWNISTHLEVWPVLVWIHPEAPYVILYAAGAVAAFALIRLGVSMTERIRAGRAPALPEGSFLLASLLLFHPYLWMRDSAMATFAMLIPHYVQYLGIVWLIHRRKFRDAAGGSPSQSLLARLSTDMKLLVPVLLMIGMAFYVGSSLSRRLGLFPHFETLYLFIAFQHFYLDGLFWAMKRREIRGSIAPYFLRSRDVPAAAA